ncbi:MAG TPA: hypothetical protein VN948_16520 [Terriglobales bacterium]|nr:hypothetical protein [Terriglobales bacterium]
MKNAIARFSRPRPQQVSEEMKAWAAALAGELATWPKVHSRLFFGFTAIYREDKIFALLPRTRVLEPSNSVAFKLVSSGSRVLAEARSDSRIANSEMQKARWFTFTLSAEADLRDALEWLLRAYEAAP